MNDINRKHRELLARAEARNRQLNDEAAAKQPDTGAPGSETPPPSATGADQAPGVGPEVHPQPEQRPKRFSSPHEFVVALANHMHRGHHWSRTQKHKLGCIREPLSDEKIKRSVDGGAPVGLCPIVPGTDTTRTALLDFDSHKGEVSWDTMTSVVRRVRDEARERGLKPMAFRSGGGNGIHLGFLWHVDQDAYTVRQTLNEVLAACDLKSGTKGVAHGTVEVFPKQDSVPADGFGNMWVLPFSRESVALNEELEPVTSVPPLAGSLPLDKREKPVIEKASSAPDAPELERVVSAVKSLKPREFDYDTWRSVVFAIHDATEGSEAGLQLAQWFNDNVMPHDKGNDWLETQVWDYIRMPAPGTPMITFGSLVHLAREEGWADPKVGGAKAPSDEGFEEVEPERRDPQSLRVKYPQFAPIADDAYINRPPMTWHIKGLLPRSEIVIVFGPSNQGKSLITLDMGIHIVNGWEWQKRKVRKGRVVYVLAEGAAGFTQRLRANQMHVKQTKLGVELIAAEPQFKNAEHVRALAAHIGKADVIFVETLHRVAGGVEENSATEMGVIIGAGKTLHRLTGATVVFNHHSGKDVSRGSRGSNAIQADSDAELSIVEEPDIERGHRLGITKQRDGERAPDLLFRRDMVQVGVDEDMQPIYGPVVVHLGEAGSERKLGDTRKRRKASPTGPVQQRIIDTLNRDITNGGMSREQLVSLVLDATLKAKGIDMAKPEDVEAQKAYRAKRKTARETIERSLDTMIEDRAVIVQRNRLKLAEGEELPNADLEDGSDLI